MIPKTSSLTGIRCSEQTEVKHVDNNQIVGPVQEIEHEEDGGEKVHGHPVHPLIRHLYLLPDTPRVSLMIAPLSVNLLGMVTVLTSWHHTRPHVSPVWTGWSRSAGARSQTPLTWKMSKCLPRRRCWPQAPASWAPCGACLTWVTGDSARSRYSALWETHVWPEQRKWGMRHSVIVEWE